MKKKDLQTDGKTHWKNNGIWTTRVLREYPWKHELNMFSSLGGDLFTSLITKLRQTNWQTNGETKKNNRSYRDQLLRGDLKIKKKSNSYQSYIAEVFDHWPYDFRAWVNNKY